MIRGYSNKVIGQIGEFLACAEIARRCQCITTPFAGNVPLFDILVTNEISDTLPVQVKTAKHDTWQFDAKKYLEIELDDARELQSVKRLRALDHGDMIWVFISLGDGATRADRYFVCTLDEFQRVLRSRHSAWLKKHNGHRPKNWKSTHCSVSIEDLVRFENRWNLISERLTALGSR